jgi:ribosomal protein S18 acetylase RimI-like enzyme
VVHVQVRAMLPADLPAAGRAVEAAFAAIFTELYGERAPAPAFPRVGFACRLAANPDGCLVAVEDGEIAGAVFSLRRGPLAWFGPLAVTPEHQRRGVAGALLRHLLAGWERAGVRTMGLETFTDSSFHIGLYRGFGFQPAWVGVSYRKPLEPAGSQPWPDDAVRGGSPPRLDFLYPGFDPSAEIAAMIETGAGELLTCPGGIALCHLEGFHTSAEAAFLPLVVAADRASFTALLTAAERLAAGAGKRVIATRLPGGCSAAQDVLAGRGYLPGGVMLRMKRGERVDYDGPEAFYCDDWL